MKISSISDELTQFIILGSLNKNLKSINLQTLNNTRILKVKDYHLSKNFCFMKDDLL